MNLGQRIAALRNYKRLTQEQMAEALNVKRARYSAWENGISHPDHEMLGTLARFHGVTVDFLLGLPHPNGVTLLSDDMYADGYTDENFFEDLEKELERNYRLSKQLSEHTSKTSTEDPDDEIFMIARKVKSLNPEKRKLISSLLDTMTETGKKALEDDAD